MSQSAFLLAGTSSGSGKTTITLGILAAIKARGLQVQPFKCGPDFIDPTLHQMVTGAISPNLDVRMCGSDFCRQRFLQDSSARDVAVVEGVMGLFDGGEASSASLAKLLDLPVILVVDASSAAESVAAVVKGFETFDQDCTVAGVIFNRVGSARHRELIERGMEGNCNCTILGFFPRNKTFSIPDRHLGLHMGSENPLNSAAVTELAQAIEDHIDLDSLLTITAFPHQEKELTGAIAGTGTREKRVRLAVARDSAFCFYYPDNLQMLEECGAEICYFSPLQDKKLPENCRGIYFGGGYPELYAKTLSENRNMLESVNGFAEAGGIIYGECGGFMYLCDAIVDLKNKQFSMAGIFPFKVKMKARLSRLGYRKASLQTDCFLGKTGDALHGHEFHYSELCEIKDTAKSVFTLADSRQEGYCRKNVIAGYLHLHFGRNIENIKIFVDTLEKSRVDT